MTEAGTDRTHLVTDTISEAAYSPLRTVTAYDNAAFASVTNLATAQAAPSLTLDPVLWNLPLVELEP
jgi:hypothetical protein